MPRVPAVRRDELPSHDQLTFDTIAETRSVVDGAIQGPYGVMLYSPAAAKTSAQLGAYYRHESVLPSRLRHVLALAVARELDCQYEFTVHADLARRDGVPAEAVAQLGRGLDTDGLTPLETLTVRFVRQLVGRHRVDSATFEAVREGLGLRGLSDLVGNIGYLMLLGCFLNAHDVEVRPEQTPELPARDEDQ